MKIQIAENLRVVKLDDFNWSFEVYKEIIDRKTKEVARIDWKGDNGYFSTMEGAAKAGILRVCNGDLKLLNSLEEYKEHVSKTMNEILNKLKDEKTKFKSFTEATV